MKIPTLFRTLFMVFLIYCTSCKKCTQSELVNLKFTTEDLNVNPYSQNEWLVFKNLSGDSIIFLHGKRATDSFTYYQYPDNQYDHGCTGNYYIILINSMEILAYS
jgi:hypothetical protein